MSSHRPQRSDWVHQRDDEHFLLHVDSVLLPPDSLLTPGSWGHNDGFDPNDTPARLDALALPFGASLHHGRKYRLRLVREDFKQLEERRKRWLGLLFEIGHWDYDPKKKLDVPQLNPQFVAIARRVFEQAVKRGLYPRVGTGYRSDQKSDELYQAYRAYENYRKNGGPKVPEAGKANPGGGSAHNYGLAFDVTMFDYNHERIFYVDQEFTSHKLIDAYYQKFHEVARDFPQLVWGGTFSKPDRPHYEYHPNWTGGADAAFLRKVHQWAEDLEQRVRQTAVAPGREAVGAGSVAPPVAGTPAGVAGAAKGLQARMSAGAVPLWLQYVWWAAGAGGQPPPPELVRRYPPPAHPGSRRPGAT